MPEFAYIPRAVSPERLQAIRQAMLHSPLVSQSTLAGTFERSRGFAVTFQAAGRARVEQRFPPLKEYFAQALGEPASRALQARWRRWRKQPVTLPNAWYLNLLLVGEGGSIARHLDTTLTRESGVEGATPLAVTVLYLRVPQRSGGELVIARDERIKGVVEPTEGGLVHFRGDLLHEVLEVSGLPAGEQRASLVLEQYCFPDEALKRLPEFKVDSRGGFSAYLQHHGQRPPSEFELEPPP